MSTEDDTTRKAKRAAQNKAWREANKERLKAYDAGRRRENAANAAAYRARHPERVAAYKERTKPQMAEYQAAYYEENKERITERTTAYYEENKDAIRAKQKAAYCPVKQRARVLSSRYGLTRERYAEMLRKCGDRCECCKTLFYGTFPGGPCVDHCHKTGKIRGLLCQLCNRALGHVNDDPKLLRAMARYLERLKE